MSLKKEKKMFKTASLPFQGQKRRFAGGYVTALSELKDKRKISIIVDLFGGSGLLSHIAKNTFPDCKVVYNDFDNYSQRLHNRARTNLVLADIRNILTDEPKDKKVQEKIVTTQHPSNTLQVIYF